MTKKGFENFYKVPHLFEERFGKLLSPSEKYFFIYLLKLENRYANENGWFWHIDKTKCIKGKYYGFENFGFSPSFCKRARNKLRNLGLISTSVGRNKHGNVISTWYHINWDNILNQNNPKGNDKCITYD
jgi:hypothetical protein